MNVLETYFAGFVGGMAVYHLTASSLPNGLDIAGILHVALLVIVVYLSLSLRRETRKTTDILWDERSDLISNLIARHDRLESNVQSILDDSQKKRVD